MLRQNTMVSKNQTGFMPRRSTNEVIHLLRHPIEKYRERHKDLYIMFVDLPNMYDSVLHEMIWTTLEDRRVSRSYVQAIQFIYCWYTTCVRTAVGDIESVLVKIRLHRRSTLNSYISLWLWTKYTVKHTNRYHGVWFFLTT